MDEKDPKTYELAVLVKAEEELAGITAILKSHGVALQGEMQAKKLALAYPVKKEKEATFGSVRFDAVPSVAKALEDELRLKPELLRTMIIVADPISEPRSYGDESRMKHKPRTAAATVPVAPAPRESQGSLTNDDLEKKLEEILK